MKLPDLRVTDHDEVIPEAVDCSSPDFVRPNCAFTRRFQTALQWLAFKTGLHVCVAPSQYYGYVRDARSGSAASVREPEASALVRNLELINLRHRRCQA